MANEDGFSRNFRSTYYEKVGFCGIEEKKVLDVLIASSPLDTEKLGDFCVRFDLARRREEVWKLLLGVDCNLKDPTIDVNRIAKIREEHFGYLKRSLCILLESGFELEKHLNFYPKKMSAIQSNTPNTFKSNSGSSYVGANNELALKDNDLDNCTISPRASDHANHLADKSTEKVGKFLTLMYLLEIGQLKLNTTKQLESTSTRVMVSMATVFVNMSTDQMSAFFLFRNFCSKLSEQQNLLRLQYEKSLTYLSQEMPKLDRHIRSICNFDELPCWYWFRYCFFDMLDEKSMLRLWDRIVGGCLKCIQKVMKAILIKLEPFLLASECQEDVVKILMSPLKREESENLIISVCDK